jgi:hypothetical protein
MDGSDLLGNVQPWGLYGDGVTRALVETLC